MVNNLSISNFSHTLKVIIAALTVFIAFNFLLARIMPFCDSTDVTAKSISNGSLHIPADILFIGDSRTHLGMDPSAFDEAALRIGYRASSLNLASAGMQGPFYYFTLADYLKHVEKRPKVIIANISFYLLGGDQWFQDIYRAYYTPTIELLTHAVAMNLQSVRTALEWYVQTHLPALRYRKRIASLVDIFASDPLHGLGTDYAKNAHHIAQIQDLKSKGYLSFGTKRMIDSDISLESYSAYKIGFHTGYDVYQNYFRLFFETAYNNRIHVIIYPFPWPLLAKQSTNFQSVYAYYDALIRDLAKENPYVHFVDYDFYWNNDYFADPLHVNQKGADRLSALAACWPIKFNIISAENYSDICK